MSTTLENPTETCLHQFHELARRCEDANKEKVEQVEYSDTAREILHELSQPLTAIGSFGAIALNSLDGETEHLGDLRTILQQMVNASNLAAAIIGRFRDANNGRQLQTKEKDITTIVRDAVELLAHPLGEKGVQVCYNMTPACVDVDPVQIQEVLINLIRNAIEAIPATGGRIDINITEQFGQVVVSIVDNGPGIVDEISEALFHPIPSSKENGMGIGLAVSKSIVESHGGKIWCSEHSPQGASFHFTLPMPQQAY